jgi:putative tryptophan/tyrosine transport system permease protein
MNYLQIINSLELGLIYGIVSIAVFLTFRIINFADLTVDGAFPLGAAVVALLLEKGVGLPLAMGTSFLAGSIAGAITGYLNVRYKIMEILAGILVATALYSINMRIMGRPNIALMSLDFSDKEKFITIAVTALIIATLVIVFLKTKIGLSFRALGQSPQFTSSCGVNSGNMTILALSLSNALVSLAGGLFVVMQGFADISMGAGTIIIGLASVIIGEKLVSGRSVSILVLAMLLGSILYRVLITIALNLEVLNLEPSDLNLISTILVVTVMIAPMFYKKMAKK